MSDGTYELTYACEFTGGTDFIDSMSAEDVDKAVLAEFCTQLVDKVNADTGVCDATVSEEMGSIVTVVGTLSDTFDVGTFPMTPITAADLTQLTQLTRGCHVWFGIGSRRYGESVTCSLRSFSYYTGGEKWTTTKFRN